MQNKAVLLQRSRPWITPVGDIAWSGEPRKISAGCSLDFFI
jgi:hypothetical protein